MTSPAEIIDGAKFRSDLQDSNRVLQAEWIRLANESIQSAWNVFAAARPDFQVASADFTVASGNTASFILPHDFMGMIDVVFGPDTSQEYSLGPFNWQNRKSPGGWYWPALLGFTSGYGASRCRVMGNQVFLEPSLQAAGIYRLWYCPKAHVAVQVARLATTAPLPACTAAGAGVGKTLTGTGTGAITVDGALPVVNDILLIKNQAATGDNGVYTVINPGSSVAAFVLVRTPGFDTTFGIEQGDYVGVGQSNAILPVGVTNEGKFFTLTTFTAIESAQTWTEGATIDPILEMFVEVLQLKATITALQRDGRGATAAPYVQTLMGPDGKSGLMGEAKWYFAQTRASYVQKMVDTDVQLFSGGGSWGGWR